MEVFLKMEGSYMKEKGCKINKKISIAPLPKKTKKQNRAFPKPSSATDLAPWIVWGNGWLTWAGWPAPEGVESPWRWEQRELRRHTGSTVQPPTCVCEARDTPLGGAGRSRWGQNQTGWTFPGQALAQGRGLELWWVLHSGWYSN